MSQPDLLTQLRESRPIAPAEVREHVRQIAAQAKEPKRARRSPNWRRAFVIAVPVAAAVAAGVVFGGGASHQTASPPEAPPSATLAPVESQTGATASAGATLTTPTFNMTATGSAGAARKAAASGEKTLPATNPNRVQRVTATLQLRVPNAQAVSDGTKQAVAITRALGGYASKLDVNASGRTGYADLTLRIPKQNVQKAVNRLSALGTIMGENVSIQDIQAQVDATTRKLERLQARRAAWQAQPQTDETQSHIAGLTDQISKLKHSRTATVRSASYATVGLEMTTKEAPAPLHHGKSHFHGLGVAFRWIGIGAVYGLALGAPVVLLLGLIWLAARVTRRRREDALLNRA